MINAVTYARYSTDMQSEASIEDQQRNCRNYAERNRLTIIEHYADKATSGTISNRTDYQRLLKDAEAGGFQVLLVDDLSRLSRNTGEFARLRDYFEYMQIRIIGVTDGIDTAQKNHKIHSGIKSLFSEMYIDDIREKTHRGLMGKALRGKVAGGRVYGYKNVPIEHPTDTDQYGRPRIVDVEYAIREDQAEIVRQIFNWYGCEGRSYAWIAHTLNAQGIDSPHKRQWSASTIRDMLRNQIYIGQYSWNRKRKIKNSETGARRYIDRPENEWVINNAPHLRILEEKLWQSVKNRFDAIAQKQTARITSGVGGNHKANPKHLFSGLLKCGKCGGSYTIVNRSYYGCGINKSKGDAVCDNRLRVRKDVLEDKLLTQIKQELLSDKAYEHFKQKVTQFAKQYEKGDTTGLKELQERLAVVEKELSRIIEAIKSGLLIDTLTEAAQKSENERKLVLSQIEAIEQRGKNKILPFIPAALQRYKELIANLENELSRDIQPAREKLKKLVGEEIILYPGTNYLEAQLNNSFDMLLKNVSGICTTLVVPRTGTLSNSTKILLPARRRDSKL